MVKFIILLFAFIFFGCSSSQKILKSQPYLSGIKFNAEVVNDSIEITVLNSNNIPIGINNPSFSVNMIIRAYDKNGNSVLRRMSISPLYQKKSHFETILPNDSLSFIYEHSLSKLFVNKEGVDKIEFVYVGDLLINHKQLSISTSNLQSEFKFTYRVIK